MPYQKITAARWASRALPAHSKQYHALELSNWKLMLAMNVGGVLLLFLFGWLFMGVAAALNPQFFMLELRIFVQLLNLVSFIGTIFGVMLLHELIHALFFWLFSGERPRIGFHILYAYAAAPGWAFRLPVFFIIGAAPLLLISLTGLLLLPAVSLAWSARIILALTVNAAGSIGDILVLLWLLSQPRDCWIVDEGARITLYRQSEKKKNLPSAPNSL